MDAKVIVNGIEVSLNHQEIDELPDLLTCSEKNQAVFHELAKSPSSLVRESMAYNKVLPEETVALLLKDKSIDVLRRIVENSRAVELITEDDMDRLISTEDTELMTTIAENIDNYYLCDPDFICDRLVNQANPHIRLELAKSNFTPRAYLKKLAKDTDIYVSEKASAMLKELEEDDLEDEENPLAI
ncbi:MAG: hypothetical protein JRE47_07635 [Deltaproteobacteria bacterium]|nr:hypothetical protein [Deltaproteobacteria bacterium]